MAYFLITYDRAAGELLSEQAFDDHAVALTQRLGLEQELSGRPEVEIVVLAAESAAELRRTHARYFNSLRQLADDVIANRRAAQPTMTA